MRVMSAGLVEFRSSSKELLKVVSHIQYTHLVHFHILFQSFMIHVKYTQFISVSFVDVRICPSKVSVNGSSLESGFRLFKIWGMLRIMQFTCILHSLFATVT